jgi:hypothetical protein
MNKAGRDGQRELQADGERAYTASARELEPRSANAASGATGRRPPTAATSTRCCEAAARGARPEDRGSCRTPTARQADGVGGDLARGGTAQDRVHHRNDDDEQDADGDGVAGRLRQPPPGHMPPRTDAAATVILIAVSAPATSRRRTKRWYVARGERDQGTMTATALP